MTTKRYLYWKEEPRERKWKGIPDTPEARQQAVDSGAMFFTWTSYVDNGAGEPTRTGDFPFDFDCEQDPGKALREMKELFLVHLPKLYDLDPYTIKFYATGQKGFCADLPAKIFDAHLGDIYLPLIYKRIAADWSVRFNLTTLDLSMYAMGNGKMYRIPNVRRENGRYKVPLSLEEVRYLDVSELVELTKAPRTVEPVEVDLCEIEELGGFYRNTRALIHQEAEERPEPVKMSPEDREKLSKKLAPCIRYIVTELPPKSDQINFNKLIMIVANYFQFIGLDKKSVWDAVKNLVETYPDSATYNTKEKRIAAWKAMWTFLEGNAEYSFNCSYIKGLGLPGSAFECKECIGKEDYIYPLEPQYSYLEYVEADLPERPHYMDLFIPQQGYILFAAASKQGKTILGTDIAHCVAFGIPFLGEFKVPVPTKTLILQSEINDSYFQQRVRANRDYLYRVGHARKVEKYERNLIIHPLHQIHDLEEHLFEKWLTAFVERNEIKFVLIDPLQDFTTKEIEKNHEMNLLTQHLRNVIKKLDISIKLIHHMGKQGMTARQVIDDFRGASILAGRADLFFIMRAINTDTEDPMMELHFKPRYWPEVEPIQIKRNNTDFWYEKIKGPPAVEALAREICTLLAKVGALSATNLKQEFKSSNFYKAIAFATEQGWIKKEGKRDPYEVIRDEDGIAMHRPDAKTF